MKTFLDLGKAQPRFVGKFMVPGGIVQQRPPKLILFKMELHLKLHSSLCCSGFRHKNMTKTFGIWFLLIVFLQGCKQKPLGDLSVISVPREANDAIPLSIIGSVEQEIQLETKEDAFLRFIFDVKSYRDRVFVSDGRKISIFDLNGNYVQNLGNHGDGPGEFRSVSSMDIDEATGKIYVSAGYKLMVYDSAFQLIDERKLDYRLNFLKVIEGKLWIVSEEIAVKLGDGGIANQTNIYRLDKDYENPDTVPFRAINMDQERVGGYPFRHWISDLDGENFMFMPVLTPENLLRDTLYRIEGNTIKPAVRFQFERPQSLDENDYQTLLLYNIVNSKSYYLLEYDQDWKRFMFLYDKKAQKGYNLSEGLIDQAGDAVFLRPLDLNQDLFYYIKKVEFEDKSIEEQNPLIGIVKLK